MPRFLSDKLCPVRAKRERRKEARPGELIQAALELFVEKGFAATRSEEVAVRAGVSKGTLFLYFQSKEDLLKAVITENLAGRFTEWNAEFESFEGSTPDMLRYCTRVWWERVGATPISGLTKLMLSEGNNFPELAAFYRREVVEPGHALMRRILQRGIDRGEFLAVDVDHAIYSVVAPMIFLFLTQHSATWVEDGIAFDPLTYVSTQTEIVIRGLSREPLPFPSAT
ncbi:TetR/AcrR family transcriptional regulator [Variovorax guangxiensis]|uniref:TetR/AcrR family transcriptional regulator n=1 Tax=Variovorax guangxiensis TaxID=1775474 RepID=A0A502DT37_9BURK|nr:TetR/AcrR family transcriptional regulator [Variovorax guangxiensis]RZI67834.1 MAG: TetR/AcrR family transcriptional regulator [Variovorax sp.]TPG23171.1 TetR/AcrR family transcriptional regulator [Variovorax ginsengisoli]TPG27719.1 TetR/AcrR family transcriptional regulator [Variovorax guangxiensis]